MHNYESTYHGAVGHFGDNSCWYTWSAFRINMPYNLLVVNKIQTSGIYLIMYFFSVVDKWYILVDEHHVQVWSRLDHTERILVHVWTTDIAQRTGPIAVELIQRFQRRRWWSMGEPGWFSSDQIRRNGTVCRKFTGFVTKPVRNNSSAAILLVLFG